MKRLSAVAFCCIAIALGAGCRTTPTASSSSLDVQVEGDTTFPPALVGRWKADRDGWEFVFAPDGQILSAVHSLGRVEIAPGQEVTLPTRGGGQGRFESGTWTVYYAPQTRQLTVKVVLDHVRIDMAGTILEGMTTDVFSGAVQLDTGIWQVRWTAFNRYQLQTPDGATRDLSTDETYGETKALTFQKAGEP